MKKESKPSKSMPYFNEAKNVIVIKKDNFENIYIEKREVCIIAQQFSDDVLKAFSEHLSSRYRTIKKETIIDEIRYFKNWIK